MSSSKLTLMGLYQWNNELFKNLSVPTGIDTSILIDNILIRSAEFEVIYADFDFNQYMIGAWSRKWLPTFQRWIDALAIEYAPLENYDRQEAWTDANTGTQTMVGSGSETNLRTGSEKDEADNGSTTENQVSAYDSAGYTSKDKTIFDTDQTNEHTYNDVTDEHTLNDLTSERTDDLLATHRGRVHGNIGVTTSQQMLRQELDLGYWNIYEKITDLFLTEFTIPVY